jgi:uncharacterized protein (TIGR00290 family)
MPTRPRAAISWSGGKDCCLALMRVWRDYDVCTAITMFDDAGARSRSHGLRPDVLTGQADRLGLSTIIEPCSWETYTDAFARALVRAKAIGCTHVIFGDIFEDAHLAWTEARCRDAGFTAVQPLWGEPTHALVREFIDRGGDARLTTVRQPMLDATWLGRQLTHAAVDELTALGADPCGERGEYHSVVVHCPLFSSPLVLTPGEIVERGGCWAVDFVPEAAHAPR